MSELGPIRSLYQPIVDLETGAVLGVEALARGPAGTEFESPVALLGRARAENRLREIDWECRAAALRGALDAGLGASTTLFMNIAADGESAEEIIPEEHRELVERADRELRIILEITEAAIVDEPADLLRLVDWARSRSWGVALDDVGADPNSLAIMPFLEPDVVKLDLRLVQDRTCPEVGSLVSAVLAQAERTGAQIVAEGIETESHRATALALGATLGQGWLFGRPEPLEGPFDAPQTALELKRLPPIGDEITPFSIVRAARPLRRASKELLLDLSAHLEEQAVAWNDNPVVLSTFEPDEELPSEFLERYAALSRQGSFVAIVGGRPPEPLDEGGRRALEEIYFVEIGADHRLADDWSVVVVGPHYAGALVARRIKGDSYDFAVSHDRSIAIEAGRTLLRCLSRSQGTA